MVEYLVAAAFILVGVFAGVGLMEARNQKIMNECAAKFEVYACIIVARPAKE